MPTIKNKKNFSIIAIITSGLVLLILVGAWLSFDYEISTPPNKLDDAFMVVKFQKGTKISQIATDLQNKKLIRSSFFFEVYVRFGRSHGQLQAGTYEFSRAQTIKEIVNAMHEGKFAIRRIVVAEGLNSVEIGKVVEQSNFHSKSAFLSALSSSYLSPALSVRPSGISSLEGLLAPGTYEPVVTASDQDLINQMLAKFNQDTASYQKKTAPQGLSFYQALTLASLVEREAPYSEDRRKIAGVFLNRLKAGMKLQSDTTTFYINSLKANNLVDNTTADTKLNSYKIPALPATPICSPSLNSLDAVYNPIASNNLYFIAGRDGTVYYAPDYATHLENIHKYID